MIRGLQIAIRGEELSQRIAERIRTHEATLSVLEARIKKREGDQPFDIRADDGFETLSELESERQVYRGRVAQLTLLRDNLVAGEIYALHAADLRLAELIPPDPADASEVPDDRSADATKNAPIEGLKLTMHGHALRTLLKQRILEHQRRSERWKREQARTPDQQTEDEPLLPEHICANEAERHTWRADVLGFIRDHIDSAETYRLGETDLEFGELLPEKPGWLQQQEYEERTSVGFHLERLTRRVGELTPSGFAFASLHAEDESRRRDDP